MSSNLCPVWGFSLFFNMVFNSLTLYLSKLTIFANFQKNSVWLNQAGSCHELHWQAAPPCGWECGTKDGCLPFLIQMLLLLLLTLDSAHQRFFSRDFATSDRKVVEKMSDRQQKTLFFLNYIIYSILDEFEITEFTDDGSIWWRTNRSPYNSYMD